MASEASLSTRLAILLPFTSRCFPTVETSLLALKNAVARLVPPVHVDSWPASVNIGIDSDDPVLPLLQQDSVCLSSHRVFLQCLDRPSLDILAAAGLQQIATFSKGGTIPGTTGTPPPLCRIWEAMALKATKEHGATAFVLLGDDIHVQPVDWVQHVCSESPTLGQKNLFHFV